MTKVAVWVRVSDPDQHTENQQPDLKIFVAARGWEVSQVYELQASAYKSDHQKMLSRVYQDVQHANSIFWSAGRWTVYPEKDR